jgi:hypothetical protein
VRTLCGSRIVLLIVLLGLLLIGAPNAAQAEGGFANVGSTTSTWANEAHSPRSVALGGANMAAATGPLATLNNAAPLPAGDHAGVGYGFFKFSLFPEFDLHYDYSGVCLEHGRWRFSATGVKMKSDPILIRTAYNPEGDGRTFTLEEKFVLLNASCDLVGLIMPEVSAIDWTVGLGWRYHDFQWSDDSVGGWDMDLGTSARWTHAVDKGRIEFSGSAMLRNFADQSVIYVDDFRGDSESTLPRYRDFGLAVSFFGDLADRPGDELAFRLMYSRRKNQNLDEEGFFGSERVGAELTLFEILALRVGNDDSRVTEENRSYGFGLTLPERYSGSFVIGYDFAKLNNDESFESDLIWSIDRSRTLHSITVLYRH